MDFPAVLWNESKYEAVAVSAEPAEWIKAKANQIEPYPSTDRPLLKKALLSDQLAPPS